MQQPEAAPTSSPACRPLVRSGTESTIDTEEGQEVLAVRANSRAPEVTPGSVLHSTGQCRPCAWFYKPAGCQNGAQCRHCHLCPEGAIKSVKKSKVAALRAGQAPPQQVLPPPGLVQPAELPASRGSVLHRTGDCRPCAWFYKPQGCQNGAACEHCHLCPEGAIRARRQAKEAKWCAAGAAGAEAGEAITDEASLPPVQVAPADACALEAPPSSLFQRPVPSIGSVRHGTGQCRPCAWFHKAQGCSNGAQCHHCHLCGVDELRNRRLAKRNVGAKMLHDFAGVWMC